MHTGWWFHPLRIQYVYNTAPNAGFGFCSHRMMCTQVSTTFQQVLDTRQSFTSSGSLSHGIRLVDQEPNLLLHTGYRQNAAMPSTKVITQSHHLKGLAHHAIRIINIMMCVVHVLHEQHHSRQECCIVPCTNDHNMEQIITGEDQNISSGICTCAISQATLSYSS